MNGQSPHVGGVVGSCTRDVVIEPSVVSVAVRITFHGLYPCEIAVDTSTNAPSPSAGGSPSGIVITLPSGQRRSVTRSTRLRLLWASRARCAAPDRP